MTLYIFDLDDTLIVGYMSLPDKDYHHVELLPGVKDKISTIANTPGDHIAIATNQGGIAFGHNTVDDFWRKIAWVRKALELPIEQMRVAVCVSDTRSKDPRYNDPIDAARRKPSGAMIRELVAKYPIQERVVYVGDRPEDEAAAKNAGCEFVWAMDFFAQTPLADSDQQR